jgi:Ras homolog gene family, member A
MLLGLQRDLRSKKTMLDDDGNEIYECVMPEEGLQVAREMRVDCYAECSALTGELMWEATQDLTKMAAKTTVDNGDYATELCILM